MFSGRFNINQFHSSTLAKTSNSPVTGLQLLKQLNQIAILSYNRPKELIAATSTNVGENNRPASLPQTATSTTILANLPFMHAQFWYHECTVIIVIQSIPIYMRAAVYGASTDLRRQLKKVPQKSGTELHVTASNLQHHGF